MTERGRAGPRTLVRDGVRYTAVVVLGLVLDVGVAMALRSAFGLPLPLAAVMGFTLAVAFNYVLFERFLFERQALSFKRLCKTYASAQGALLVRLVTAWVLSLAVHGSAAADLAVLIVAAGVSFVFNFVVVRHLLR